MFVRRGQREGTVENGCDLPLVQQLRQKSDFAQGLLFLLSFAVIMVPRGMRCGL